MLSKHNRMAFPLLGFPNLNLKADLFKAPCHPFSRPLYILLICWIRADGRQPQKREIILKNLPLMPFVPRLELTKRRMCHAPIITRKCDLRNSDIGEHLPWKGILAVNFPKGKFTARNEITPKLLLDNSLTKLNLR
jgi:hypothetical protein